MTGIPPFGVGQIEEIIDKNTNADIDYPMDIWKNVTSEALDLVVKMTEKDQYKRLSAKECLEHSWFLRPHNHSKPLTNVIYNLKSLGTEQLAHGETSKEIDKKTGFITSSPMFSKRALPKSHPSTNDVAMESFRLDQKDVNSTRFSSNNVLMNIVRNVMEANKIKTPKSSLNVNNTDIDISKEIFVVNPFLVSPSHIEEEEKNKVSKFANNLNVLNEGDEIIPSERSHRGNPKSIMYEDGKLNQCGSISKAFRPEKEEQRFLRCITDEAGVSKGLLKNSVHFTKGNRLPIYSDISMKLKQNKQNIPNDKFNTVMISNRDLGLPHKSGSNNTKDTDPTPRAETMPRKVNIDFKKFTKLNT